MTLDHLQRGLAAFAKDAWNDACRELEAADRVQPLAVDHLECLAVATYLVGRERESTAHWARAFHAARDGDDPGGAVRCAFWVAFVLLNRGDVPEGSGWVARATGIVHRARDPLADARAAYLVALRAVFSGDVSTARDQFETATAIAGEVGDPDLSTLALLGLGRTLIIEGRVGEGMSSIDEAMVAVTGGEVSPIVVGDAYCTAIDACHEVFDLPRARRWTEGLGRWCDGHADLVAFRGQCLIHRAEVLEARGAWRDALAEARRATQRLARPTGQLALGAACYQEGELHRLGGAFDEAEEAYERARHHGREPLPGLALLWLARGRDDAAGAAIRRHLAETRSVGARSRLLPGAVEVLLAVGDVGSARRACEELVETARAARSQMLDAHAARAHGAVALATDDLDEALPALRRALDGWQRLDVPYETARTRVLIGVACRRIGDEETAVSEWAAARTTFIALGARPDLEQLERLAGAEQADDHGLTPRELEVLRHVVSGLTNRAIAAELVISERTVDRHVSNILTKLGVASRTAAAAYAVEHRLA